jgi:hypothetical protein
MFAVRIDRILRACIHRAACPRALHPRVRHPAPCKRHDIARARFADCTLLAAWFLNARL